MSEQVFLGIGGGSASARAGVFDARGHRPAFPVRSTKPFHPLPLFVKPSSAGIWSRTTFAVRAAMALAMDYCCLTRKAWL